MTICLCVSMLFSSLVKIHIEIKSRLHCIDLIAYHCHPWYRKVQNVFLCNEKMGQTLYIRESVEFITPPPCLKLESKIKHRNLNLSSNPSRRGARSIKGPGLEDSEPLELQNQFLSIKFRYSYFGIQNFNLNNDVIRFQQQIKENVFSSIKFAGI